MRAAFFLVNLLAVGFGVFPASADPEQSAAPASPHDHLGFAIIGAVPELQYGNVLRFEVVLTNTGNESVALHFACFEAMAYTVMLRSVGRWEEVYRRPLCASVLGEVVVPAESAVTWSASWEQVAWNPRDPDEPPDPAGPEIHAPIGDYRIDVVVAPFDSPRQFRGSFEFRLIESEWSKPEVAYPVVTVLAVSLVLLLAYYNWRMRHPGTVEPVSKALARTVRRMLDIAGSATRAMKLVRRSPGAGLFRR